MLVEEIELCRLRVRLERLRWAVAQSGSVDMREVRNMADVLRTTVLALRERASKSASAFQGEVEHTHENIRKMDSVTKELRDANKELESVLGDTGSNFPTETATHDGVAVGDGKAPVNSDQNGVRKPTT